MEFLSKGRVFVVAEIGQNHQGSMDIAKEMIVQAQLAGADCVKFQKSCLEDKFTIDALKRPYTGENSWGATYGEHKTHLEFSLNQYRELQQFSEQVGVIFTASAMDLTSLKTLQSLAVPFIKIGSGDANNMPLLQYASQQSTPFIISTGMQDWTQVDHIYRTFRHKPTGLLHCVSSYPTSPDESLLGLIPLYKRCFPELHIGYSGHEMGVQLTVASVLLGAEIVERHFTLDKSWKGTDHQASLEPAELERMIRYIRMVERMPRSVDDIQETLQTLLVPEDFDGAALVASLRPVDMHHRKLLPCEMACHRKLGKSLVYTRNCGAGDPLRERDVGVKVSEPKGMDPVMYGTVVGRTLTVDVAFDNPVRCTDFLPEETV